MINDRQYFDSFQGMTGDISDRQINNK
jgi:hypothetical protein